MSVRAGVVIVGLLGLVGCNRGASERTVEHEDKSSEHAAASASAAAPQGPGDGPAATAKVAPTADEAKETPFPPFLPAVANPQMSSQLPCPAGAKMYKSHSSLHCAKSGAAWGAGRHGPMLSFHANGKLERQGSYQDGKAVGGFYTFDDEGRLESYGEYDGDDEHGLRVTFHTKTGKRATEGRYDHGKRVGVHKMWTEDGELWTLTTYVDGNATSTKTFDVKLRTMTPEELKAEMDKVKALEELQKKLLREMKK